MKKYLPRNLIGLALLVGPFSLPHPREVYIFSPYPPTIEQVPPSPTPSVDVLPLVRWSLSLPSVRRNPSLPALQLARSHPAGLLDLCSPGERPSVSSANFVWQFKHLILKDCLMSTIMLMKLLPLCYSRPCVRKQTDRRPRMKRVILAPGKWTDKPFLLVFLFHQFGQVYPPDPGKRNRKRL